jgi:hypothetical protein
MAQAVSRRSVIAEPPPPQSNPGQSVWGLWWTEWHEERCLYDYIGLFPSL